MPGKLLIDITDPQFFIPANDDVLEFVRTANPFAHSGTAQRLRRWCVEAFKEATG